MKNKTCIIKPYNPDTVKVKPGDIILVSVDGKYIDAGTVRYVSDEGFRCGVYTGKQSWSLPEQLNKDRLKVIILRENKGALELYMDPRLLENIEKLKIDPKAEVPPLSMVF